MSEETDALDSEIAALGAELTAITHRLLVKIRAFDEREVFASMAYLSTAHYLNYRLSLSLPAAREKVRVAHAERFFVDRSLCASQRASGDVEKVRGRSVVMSEETDALDSEIAALGAELTAITHRLLVKIRAFDEREVFASMAYLSTAHYLNYRLSLSLPAAREKVRVAHAIAKLPKIDAAFASGALSYSKVRALTRIATPEKEEELLMVAKEISAAALEKVVRGVRRVETLESAEKREEARSLTCFFDDDGMFVMQGRFLPDEGAMIMKMLEAVPSPKERMPAGKRLADALVRVSEEALSGARSEASSADRVQVVVHVDAEVLTHDALDGRAEIEGVGVSAEVSRRLACDASIVTMTHDKDGNVVNIGRKTRVISTPLRRKLKERDGTCRFPGCTNTFTDGHHVEHWSQGGATTLENLVSLCRRHHRFVHEHGYAVKRDANGLIVFRDPRGAPIANAPPALPSPTGTALATAEMVMPKYATMDYHYVVNSLVRCCGWAGKASPARRG